MNARPPSPIIAGRAISNHRSRRSINWASTNLKSVDIGYLSTRIFKWTMHDRTFSARAPERTPRYTLQATQRRGASGRSQDQLWTNTKVIYTPIVREFSEKKLRRRRTHIVEWLTDGSQIATIYLFFDKLS